MKRVALLLTVVLCFGLVGISHAELWDRGGGLIYDDAQGITWLQNANLAVTEAFGVSGIDPAGYMTPPTADEWIAALNAANYLGYSDWRLPSTDDASAWGIVPGEMQRLYIDLGNVAGPTGVTPGYGSDPVNMTTTDGNGNSVSFENFVNSKYWYDESYPRTANSTNSFYFTYGHQYAYVNSVNAYVWPVLDGDRSPIVPLPGAVLLGILGLGAAHMRLRKAR